MVKSSLEKQLEKMQKDARQQSKKQLAAAAKNRILAVYILWTRLPKRF